MDSVTVIQVPVTWLLTFALLVLVQAAAVIGTAVRVSSGWSAFKAKIEAIEKNDKETNERIRDLRGRAHSARDGITTVRLALELLLDGVPPTAVKEAMNRTNKAMEASR